MASANLSGAPANLSGDERVRNVGSVRKLSAVRWGVAGGIVWAWILTIPCSACVAAGAWWLARHAL